MEMNEEKRTDRQGFRAVLVRNDACAGCYALAPVAAKVAAAYELPLTELEATEENAALLQKWEIDKLPAFLLLDDGEAFARCYGYQPEEILEIWVEAKIEGRKASKN